MTLKKILDIIDKSNAEVLQQIDKLVKFWKDPGNGKEDPPKVKEVKQEKKVEPKADVQQRLKSSKSQTEIGEQKEQKDQRTLSDSKSYNTLRAVSSAYLKLK